MEIEVSGNSNIILKPGSKIEFGRGSGFVTDDRTVSRHHVVFELPLTISDEPKVRFEVFGRNPIWVHDSKSSKVNTFTSTQSGEMDAGDKFCVSAKNPIWFTLRKAGFGGQREDKGEIDLGFEETLVSISESVDGEDLELEPVDTSSIDPVKEFGFLVLGHEFDRYPKKMIRDMKDWDWFIEEPVKNSEDDDDEYQKRKKNATRKRKKGDENDDEEWTAESEEEKVQITGAQKVQITGAQKVLKPKYTTRSKDRSERGNDAGKNLQLKQKSRVTSQNLKEDEDDQTLGGFIVDDEFENEEESDGNQVEEEEDEELEEEDNEDE